MVVNFECSKLDLCLFSLSSEFERFELESVALRIGQPRGVLEENPFGLASSEVEIDKLELDPLKLVVLDSALESVKLERDPSIFFGEFCDKVSIFDEKNKKEKFLN
jgi:hypothetical protein